MFIILNYSKQYFKHSTHAQILQIFTYSHTASDTRQNCVKQIRMEKL